jgi:hypothetical protein
MEEDVLHSTLSVLPCQDIPDALVAPGQCNQASVTRLPGDVNGAHAPAP